MEFQYRDRTFRIDGPSEEDHIYRSIVRKRIFYEIDLLEYMAALKPFYLRPDSVAIDVGANIGNHSIYFASFLCDQVIAVEPNPEVQPVLEKNLRSNTRNCTLYKVALGERGGKGQVSVPETGKSNVGMARVAPPDEGAAPASLVDIVTLDSLLEDWRQGHGGKANVSLIKLDVEGMELAVLKGARETVAEHRPHLFAEAATGTALARLVAHLTPFGYRAVSRWGSTPVYHFVFRPSNALWWRARSFVVRRKLWDRVIATSKRLAGLRRLSG